MSTSRTPHSRRVLIVEDDEPSALLATEALRWLGCEPSTARAGDEALAMATESHFDLIFMDYHLPRLNGLEATIRIRQREQSLGKPGRTPIVGLTASALPQEREACLQAGMDDVLLKPFRLDELKSKLSRWMPERGGN